jgi:hypothetical protein
MYTDSIPLSEPKRMGEEMKEDPGKNNANNYLTV